MKRASKIPREVETLVEFSNLETNDVDYFRRRYPSFTPDDWWTMKIGFDFANGLKILPIWQYQQDELRKLWQTRFPLEGCFRLMSPDVLPWELHKTVIKFDTGEEIQQDDTWHGTKPGLTCARFCSLPQSPGGHGFAARAETGS